MALINNLAVSNTTSEIDKQTCQVSVEGQVKIFSYKCCDAEDNILAKGKDYAFTLTYGNMGECPGTTQVTDCLSVTDIGGVQFKIMDVCGPCDNHKVYVGGCFYYPGADLYFCSYPFVYSIGFIKLFNLEPVVCPESEICFYVFDGSSKDLSLAPHSINTFGAILQAEDIFCEDCPCRACAPDAFNNAETIKPLDLDSSLSKEELENEFKKLLKL
ncbi:hypothetical protein [Clostridioides difficile]|uniref:hypothetical protein n=1 Tax=Clostridioides difficile TaxID=1496 RepID=UPI00093E7950|nr:hypothetical protein [Clostridioides difficile]OYO87122.1 hypothetical protein B7359_17915 [Clostridioides difficile]TLE39687.1 hypothetical protein EDC95_14860 [Clostridioides difficile]HCQ5598794.1 hypothetical protein [Clostridioides difficile]HCQ6189339.1 hypothetical protein [Clostridioides difficile]